MTFITKYSDEESISDDTDIWRYRSFKRFKQFANEDYLHFHRIDGFQDPFEGSIPSLVHDYREKHADEFEKRVDRALNKRLREHTFANCWYMKPRESASMWERYGGDKNAIAIRSKIGNLRRAIDDSDTPIQLADVRYIDFENTATDELENQVPSADDPAQWAVIKRASFESENEFRILIQRIPTMSDEKYDEIDFNLKVGGIEEKVPIKFRGEYVDLRKPPSRFGMNIDCDPNDLVERVYVDPEAEEEYLWMVKYAANNFGLDTDKISQSGLNSDVLY